MIKLILKVPAMRICSWAAITVAAAVFVPSVGAAEWQELYETRLSESIQYRQAVLDRRTAELQLQQLAGSFVPYVDVGLESGSSDGIHLADGELQPISVVPALRFEGLFGADVELSAPLGVYNADEPLTTIALTVSRQLLPEDDVALLQAQAAMLLARDTEYHEKLSVRLNLIEDILQARYEQRRLTTHRDNLSVLERLRSETSSVEDEREISRRILQAQRGILQAEHGLQGLDAVIRNNEQGLYEQIMQLADQWLRDVRLDGVVPAHSRSIRALEYELSAAELRRRRWLLPYFPNPVVSGGISYDITENRYSWNLVLQFTVDVFDKGERSLAAFRRREERAISRLRLHSEQQTLMDSVKNARNQLRIGELDHQLQELELEDAIDAEHTMRALYEEGLESEESLILSGIDVAVERLTAMEIEHANVMRRLRMLGYYEY